MKHIVATIVVAIAFVTWSTEIAIAQRAVPSVEDISVSGFEEASAYYDPATGEIYLSVGAGIRAIGVLGENFSFFFTQFDPSLVNSETLLGAPTYAGPAAGTYLIEWAVRRPDSLDSGIFNIGALLPDGGNSVLFPSDFDRVYPNAELRYLFTDISTSPASERLGVISRGIPEPSSSCIMFFWGAGFLMRRQRK